MKKAGLISGALFLGGLFCLFTQGAVPAHAEDSKATVIAKPTRDWQEPPIQDLTGQGGKVVRKICAIESRFDNEILMAVLRNRDDEYALRMFFPTMMFAPGVTYPMTLTSGGESGSFDAVPVYPGTVLVELGRDDGLLTSWRDTGSMKVSISKSAFDFRSGNMEHGLDLLTACADELGSAVSSAGVAGPLPTGTPTSPGTAPGMTMPPSVARIDAPSRVKVADLGDNKGSVASQGHVQEQMVLKPLKSGAQDATADIVEPAVADAAEKEEEPKKSGLSMFSIFGDVDESEVESGTITAQKHYSGKTELPVTPKAAKTEETDSAVKAEMAVETEKQPQVSAAPSGENMAETPTVESVKETVAKADDDRMIVFADETPVEKAQPVPAAPAKKPASTPGSSKAKIEDVLAAAQQDTDKPQGGADIEARLAELEKRLSAEVERNRQLEMQLREMNAKPVTGNASIDLENPDKPAETMQQSSTEDRVEAARQEREKIKHEKLKQRMETLTGLLSQAGVRTVANPAPEGDLSSENNAFSWHTGRFYGGAEFGAKPRDVAFSSLVTAYLDATGQRCEGDFASHLERLETRDTGSIATAELVCVGQGADSAAAVVFYEDSRTFAVISHEGSSEELTQAISIRDNIAHAIGSKM